MPNLNDITMIINAALTADEFASRRFQSARFNGVAERIRVDGEEVERWEVAVIDDSGDAVSVCIDDNYSLQVYHRIESLNYPYVEENDYGLTGHTITEVADMRLVFFGDRARLKVRPENIAAAVAVDIPKELVESQFTPLQLNSCFIEIGQPDIDPYSVWDKEFIGSPMKLGTATMMISIPYKITSTFNKTCFQICN